MNLEPYDAGRLGGDDNSPTCWWHEYIRSELAAAHDFYQAHIEGVLKELAAHTVQGEPVAWSGWGCQYPGKMPRLYGERRIAELNCDWENGDQLLYFTAAAQHAESDEERLAMEAVMESVDPATWPGLTTAQRCALGRFAKPQHAEQEPFAWATFDGEGSYDLRLYEENENYRDAYLARNKNPMYRSWVFPLYTTPPSPTDVAGLVEALDIALNGSRIDDLNRDNDDLWRTCYPVLNDHQRKIFEAHIKRLEQALAAYRKGGNQ